MNNYIQEGEVLTVACSDPATPTSGAPVRFGYLTGVAVTAEGEGGNAATETTVHFGEGVFDLSVKGVDQDGNSAVAVGDMLFYVDADTPKLSKKNTGYLFGFALEAVDSAATATINVLHVQSPGSGSVASGAVTTSKLGANAVTAAKLTATMATGFIPLDITTAKIIGSNVIANLTEGLLPDGNTAPLLERVNAATDKALRVTWASSSSVEIQFAPIVYPPDLDDAAAVTVHFMAAMEGASDTPVLTVSYWEGVGDTNAGGNTAAVTGTSVAEYSVSIAHGDVGAHPKTANIGLTPGAHTTDKLYLYSAWVEYTRK